MYPACGEAVVYLPRDEPERPPWASDAQEWDTSAFGYQPSLDGLARTLLVEDLAEAWDEALVENADVDERHAENRRRAGRRARTRVRRYCKANRLTRLATLTFRDDVRDRDDVLACLDAFWRELRAGFGFNIPYLWVIEEHKTGALHVHFVLNRMVAMRCDRCDPAGTGKGMHQRDVKGPCLSCTWGHGFVNAKRIKGQKDRGDKGAASTAASYVAKYVSKEVEAGEHSRGKKSYNVAQGFQPECIEEVMPEPVRAFATIGHIAGTYFDGCSPSFVWSSDDVEDWKGPPTRVIFWDGP